MAFNNFLTLYLIKDFFLLISSSSSSFSSSFFPFFVNFLDFVGLLSSGLISGSSLDSWDTCSPLSHFVLSARFDFEVKRQPAKTGAGAWAGGGLKGK